MRIILKEKKWEEEILFSVRIRLKGIKDWSAPVPATVHVPQSTDHQTAGQLLSTSLELLVFLSFIQLCGIKGLNSVSFYNPGGVFFYLSMLWY